MGKIISVHSFRGGTGKSNITANLSYVLASLGKRVCVVDTDVQSPGIHVPLQLTSYNGPTLDDYLFNNVDIETIAIDISDKLGLSEKSFYFVPSSLDIQAITKVLKEGYDVASLADAFSKIQEDLELDYLIIDTHPGLNEETLLSIAMSDTLFIIMRPDKQDFQGTSVTVEIARRLDVKNTSIIVNMVAPSYDHKQVRKEVFKAFNCEVREILPHTYQLTELASNNIFCKLHPHSEWSKKINNIAKSLM